MENISISISFNVLTFRFNGMKTDAIAHCHTYIDTCLRIYIQSWVTNYITFKLFFSFLHRTFFFLLPIVATFFCLSWICCCWKGKTFFVLMLYALPLQFCGLLCWSRIVRNTVTVYRWLIVKIMVEIVKDTLGLRSDKAWFLNLLFVIRFLWFSEIKNGLRIYFNSTNFPYVEEYSMMFMV